MNHGITTVFCEGETMKILTVDNERPALNILNRAIMEAVPGAELRSFSVAEDAVLEIREKGFCSDLVKSLRQAGAEQILIREHDSLAINPEMFDCDYYMALEGDSTSVNQFVGEYMMPYSWAEFTAGGLATRYGIT